MIVFDHVSVRYPGHTEPTLSDLSVTITEAELCLVVGRTGSGKSTLLRAINGLVPHFTGGTLTGRVLVAGRDTSAHPPREFADLVGIVSQDPSHGFVTDAVEDELAYGMESLGLPEPVMRRRVEETLDVLGLADLRHRALTTLSGGERQRVAIGSVLTGHPSVLVLDEPTSALDPPAAEEVLAVIQRLVHDLGLTVVLAEHRLERVVHLADKVIHLAGAGRRATVGDPPTIMATSSVAPPVVELGRLAGWSPLPLSVRDARRRAATLTDRLTASGSMPDRGANDTRRHAVPPDGTSMASARGLWVRYGSVTALRGLDLALHRGQVVALMGRNGAGKSTLLHALVGLVGHDTEAVRIDGRAPADLAPRELARTVSLVPQDPGDLLYAESVEAECRAADRDLGVTPGTCRGIIERFLPDVDGSRHPRDLSEGQRLMLALAVALTASPPLVLLDEPTRGLDYAAKQQLATLLRSVAMEGRSVVVATHDVEFAAVTSDRTLVIAEGELVVDGPTAEVVVASPSFAPQVAKIMAPLPLLTVEDVRVRLAGEVA